MYNIYLAGPRKGQPKTLTDRVIRFLSDGLKMPGVGCNSRKYRKFVGAHVNITLWVGKNGSVRAGKTITDSISMSQPIHDAMKVWERKEGKECK